MGRQQVNKKPYFRALPELTPAFYAGVAKLADVSDLGSDAVRHVGSSPITRTKTLLLEGFFNGGYSDRENVAPDTEMRDQPVGIKLKRQTF
jgi:hypothetical protein